MKIKLFSIPFLDTEYINVIDFKSTADRTSYFNSLSSIEVDSNVKNDTVQSFINVSLPLSTLSKYDYLSYTDANNKTLYFFIRSKEYNTSTTSNLYIQLDVFTTYQFDITFFPSIVDRCHVPRWSNGLPTKELVSEGDDVGAYVITNKEELATTLDLAMVYTSTTPLGVVNNRDSGGGELPPPTGNGTGTFINGLGGLWEIPCLGSVNATWLSYEGHKAIDIGGRAYFDSDIWASQSGTVVSVDPVGTNTPYGKNIKIKHQNGYSTRYNHLNSTLVSVGNVVAQGQIIGKMGNTGNVIPAPTPDQPAAGTHLDWELYDADQTRVKLDTNNILTIGKIITKNQGVLS